MPRQVLVWLSLAGVMMSARAAEDAAVPAFKQLDSLEARTQGCVTCHGQAG